MKSINRWHANFGHVGRLLLFALILSNSSCNKPPYELALARGKVTLDGKPVTNAKVMFAPVSKGESSKAGKPAFGLIESDGNFVLSTYEPNDGAVVGEHWVTVIRLSDDAPEAAGPHLKRPTAGGLWDRVIYPIRQVVAANQENVLSIDLTSDVAAKFGQIDD